MRKRTPQRQEENEDKGILREKGKGKRYRAVERGKFIRGGKRQGEQKRKRKRGVKIYKGKKIEGKGEEENKEELGKGKTS